VAFAPVIMTDANHYDAQFAAWNKDGNGDNVHVRMAFVPFEEAEESEATQLYLKLVDDAGGKRGLLGAQATSSFLLWATAAKECPNLTRQCVLDELKKVTKWTGGGLHAETNPAENLPPGCGMTLKLDGPKWVRMAPTEAGEFDCSPDHIVKVTGAVVDRVQLDENRVATKYVKK
jgi:hypothetical protein